MQLFRTDLEQTSILRQVVGDEFNQGQAPYCVAISKECKYYDEINAAVKVLIKNGTTDELYAKWCE